MLQYSTSSLDLSKNYNQKYCKILAFWFYTCKFFQTILNFFYSWSYRSFWPFTKAAQVLFNRLGIRSSSMGRGGKVGSCDVKSESQSGTLLWSCRRARRRTSPSSRRWPAGSSGSWCCHLRLEGEADEDELMTILLLPTAAAAPSFCAAALVRRAAIAAASFAAADIAAFASLKSQPAIIASSAFFLWSRHNSNFRLFLNFVQQSICNCCV